MHPQWQKILFKIIFSVFTEIILNVLGLDNLADYSEFIFEGQDIIMPTSLPAVTITIAAKLET